MKKVSFLVSVFLFQSLWAAGLPNYYPTSFVKSTSKNTALKAEIFKILSMAHRKNKGAPDTLTKKCEDISRCYRQRMDLSYREARRYLFGHLHLEQENGRSWIQDAYCNKWVGENDGAGEMTIPNHEVMNCEHAWPQSRFTDQFPRNLQKTDLHHLFPVDSRSNSTRSNKPFAEVDGIAVNRTCIDSQKGIAWGTNTYAFQPPAEHRGNVARAMFYFSVRFKSPIDPLQEEYLRKWHREDPVDHFERWRNNEIMQIQGNRNPFIDDPNLVGRIQDF